MKKIIFVLGVCVLFAAIPMASGLSLPKIQNVINNLKTIDSPEWDGEFLGGIPVSEDEMAVYFGGYFILKERGGFFAGIIKNKDGTKQGTIQGIFNKHILIGKISNDQGSLPIIGFIKFNDEEMTFVGRAMSVKGPAPYFVGTYSLY
jgi:hypothetical protein